MGTFALSVWNVERGISCIYREEITVQTTSELEKLMETEAEKHGTAGQMIEPVRMTFITSVFNKEGEFTHQVQAHRLR